MSKYTDVLMLLFLVFTGVRLDKLGSEMMRADLTDNQFQRLRLSIRLSVSDGVNHVYQQYAHNKCQQVRPVYYILIYLQYC